MQASIYFFGWLLTGCGGSPPPPAPQAVRVAAVRVGPVVEGRSHLAAVAPARVVQVVAEVPGTLTALAAEGEPVAEGEVLARVAAPDAAARVGRAHAERLRAERQRDLACDQQRTDEVLAAAGDVSRIQLDRSDASCTQAALAADAARAAEAEAGVVSARATGRAPFPGRVLERFADEGQAVAPGKPLLQFGSEALELELRLPAADLAEVRVGDGAVTPWGRGRVVSVGARAEGPGRLFEVRVATDGDLHAPVGATGTVTLIRAEAPDATAVPRAALREEAGGAWLWTLEGDRVRRVEVAPGPREGSWVAVSPALPADTRVVIDAPATLDPARPVRAVTP